MTISEDNLYRRRDVLGVVVSLTCLPACSESEEARRERSGLPPMTEEQKRMRKKFKGLKGGQLVVDAFGEKEAVTILDENGVRFYSSAILSKRNRSIYAYGSEFGVPIRLRAIWRREGEEINGVIVNPIRMSQQYGIYEGGTVVGDYTVPVAERIPEALLAELRTKGGGFRLKLRLHDDGLLVGWDIKDVLPTYHAGGDFREADIVNGQVVRKGWYIHPKTGERIETDF